MALLGNGLADIRGMVSGNVFTRDKSCLHVNAHGRHIKRRSTSTTKRRLAYRTCVNYWNKSTTGNTRSQWNEYANNHPRTNKVGEKFTMTAYNAFMRINLYRVFNEVSILPVPPEL